MEEEYNIKNQPLKSSPKVAKINKNKNNIK